MSSNEMLPDELCFEGGHATEIALTALVDGQEALLSAEVLSHVDGCTDCAAAMGELALRSVVTADAVRVASTALVEAPREREVAVPWWAIGGALLVALGGVLSPGLDLAEAGALVAAVTRMVGEFVWVTLRSGGPELGGFALAGMAVSVAVLVLVGVGLARGRTAAVNFEGELR